MFSDMASVEALARRVADVTTSGGRLDARWVGLYDPYPRQTLLKTASQPCWQRRLAYDEQRGLT
jgi:hypothetical protein